MTTKSTKTTVAKAPKATPIAYGPHKAGSRKGTVHQSFDAKGRDVARALGIKLGLAPATLASWMSGWNKKPAVKAAKKAQAVKRSRK